MARYIFRRLLQAIPTLLGVSLLSFYIAYSAPGDPVTMRTFDPNITEESREALRRQLGLDQPVPVQYLSWFTGLSVRVGDVTEEFSNESTNCTHLSALNFTFCDTGGGVIRGNLGTSLQTNQAVWDRIMERVPATLELGVASLLVSLLLGIPLGIFSAIYRGSIFDSIVRFLAVVGQAVPNFWMGIMLIFVFSVILKVLPSGGRQTISLTNEFDLIDRLRHMILPTIVLSLGGIAFFSRIMRTEMLEVINNDYMQTARAKGLIPTRVWLTHAFRNALIPIMTILGPAILGVLGGAIVTEAIFAWPGMGRLTFNAVLQRDYPMVLGSVMFFSIFVILGNLLSDILYGIVDPRVRLS